MDKCFSKSLIIAGRWAGFFSNILQVIDNLKYCDDNQYKPIIDLDYFKSFPYSDERKNIWDNYFEPINDSLVVGEPAIIETFFSISKYFQPTSTIDWKDFILGPDGRSILWNLTQQNNILAASYNRYVINGVIQRYITPSEKHLLIMDDFQRKNFGNSTLGVHIRGTDYEFHDFSAYVSCIDRQKDRYDKIYLATDNIEAIERIEKLYGDKVCYYETGLRAKSFIDKVVVFDREIIKDKEDKVKHGEDVLIEAYLLSRCEHLICINSNVPLMSLYVNPNNTFDLLGRSGVGG